MYDEGNMTFHVLPRLTDAQMLNDRAKHSFSGKGVSPLKIRVGLAACFQQHSPYFRPKQESISWNLTCVVHIQKENKTSKANVKVETSKLLFQGLTSRRLIWNIRDGPEYAPKSTLKQTALRLKHCETNAWELLATSYGLPPKYSYFILAHNL